MYYEPKKVITVTLACYHLHNLLIKKNENNYLSCIGKLWIDFPLAQLQNTKIKNNTPEAKAIITKNTTTFC